MKDSAQEFSSKFNGSSLLIAFVEKNLLVIGLLPSIFNFICTEIVIKRKEIHYISLHLVGVIIEWIRKQREKLFDGKGERFCWG